MFFVVVVIMFNFLLLWGWKYPVLIFIDKWKFDIFLEMKNLWVLLALVKDSKNRNNW